MSRLSNILLVLSYAMVAVIGAILAHTFAEASLSVTVLISLSIFLFCGQMHSLVGRMQERALFERELAGLHKTQRLVGQELERTKSRMQELVDLSEAKAVARNDKLITEVRVLETLVEQMADGIEQKARDKLRKAADLAKGDKDPYVAPRSIHHASELSDIFGQLSEAELIDLIQGSLDENRVDVYLQPIVSLPQRKLRFYEGFSRLRTETNEIIEPRQYLHIAETTGLISIIDNLLLFRCVQIVRNLAQSHRDLAIFCNISQHTLADQDFFPQFLDFMQANADLSKHLIFEFGQEILRNCGPVEKSNLRRLADLGFRFSLDKVQNIDLNLGELRDRDFRYVKVEPDVLLSALPDEDRLTWDAEPVGLDVQDEEDVPLVDEVELVADDDEFDDVEMADTDDDELLDVDEDQDDPKAAQAPIHAADFKELLNRYDLDLIVEKIETEREVIEMVELDVDYGQGYLFGEPRPVRGSKLADDLSEDEEVDSVEALERSKQAG